MKRFLRIISVVGVFGVTAFLIFLFVINFGSSFFGFPKIEFKVYPKVEFKVYPKVESEIYPKVESEEYPKVESQDFAKDESPDYPKVESGDPESNCDPFAGMDLSLVFLSLRKDINVLPVYLKTGGEAVPGLTNLGDAIPAEYHAYLGDIKSNFCGLQGFDDRLYCMFTVTPDMLGSVVDVHFFKENCEDPSFTQLSQVIPGSQVVGDGDGDGDGDDGSQCGLDLGPEDCEAAGGSMSTDLSTAPYCICP